MENCSIFTYLDIDHRKRLFGSTIVSGNSVYCFRNIVQHQIEIDLIFLKKFIKNKQDQKLVFKYSNQSKYSIRVYTHLFRLKNQNVFNFNYTKLNQNITTIIKTIYHTFSILLRFLIILKLLFRLYDFKGYPVPQNFTFSNLRSNALISYQERCHSSKASIELGTTIVYFQPQLCC